MSTVYADYVTNATAGTPLLLKNTPTGFVVSSTVIREDRSINIAGYNGAFSSGNSFQFGGEFTKYRDDTNLVVMSTVFAIGFYEGNGNVGVCLNRTNWDHGIAYQYDGQWDSVNQTTLLHGTHYFTASQCKAGINRLDFGQEMYASGSAGYHFNYVLNGVANIPSGSAGSAAEGRLEGYISTLHVYEIAP